MKPLLGLAREVARIFFDDGSLAIAVLVVLGLTAALMDTTPFLGLPAMVFLVSGVVAALLENVVRTARLTPSRD